MNFSITNPGILSFSSDSKCVSINSVCNERDKQSPMQVGGGGATYVFLEDVSVDKLVLLHIFKMMIVFIHETSLHLREFIIQEDVLNVSHGLVKQCLFFTTGPVDRQDMRRVYEKLHRCCQFELTLLRGFLPLLNRLRLLHILNQWKYTTTNCQHGTYTRTILDAHAMLRASLPFCSQTRGEGEGEGD